MKRMYFKKWVTYLLIVVDFLLLLIMGSDCNNLLLFFIKNVITTALFLADTYLIIKYGSRKIL